MDFNIEPHDLVGTGLFLLGATMMILFTIASYRLIRIELKKLADMGNWISMDDEHPQVSKENDGRQVLIIIHDKGRDGKSPKPRIEQARVYYEDNYSYGYLGKNKAKGTHFAIPSIVPAANVTHWQYLPEQPKGLTNIHAKDN